MLYVAQHLRRSARPHSLSLVQRMLSTYGLTDMQRSIKDTAAAFANADLAPKAAAVDRNHSFPKEAVKRMGEMGFMGIPVPEQCDDPPPPSPSLPTIVAALPPSFSRRYGGAGLDNIS